MTMKTAIRWFRQTFGATLEQAVAPTPFSADFLIAIAWQETGYLWAALHKKGLATDEILRLCVGDTIDGRGSSGRKAFPRTRAELEAQPHGAEMFAIARGALADMANATGNAGYLAALAKPDKFCRGFGVFQYDLQHFKHDPDYFLQQRYARFDESLERCLQELDAARQRVYPGRDRLTDLEQVHVGIAYNAGRFVPERGLKQGFEDENGKFYGELLNDWLVQIKAIAADGARAPAAAAHGGAEEQTAGFSQAPRAAATASRTERFAIPGRPIDSRTAGLDTEFERLGMPDIGPGEVVAVDVGVLSRASSEKVEVEIAREELVAVKLASGATIWFTPEDFLDWNGIAIAQPRDGALRELSPAPGGARDGGWRIKAITFIKRQLVDRLFAGVGNFVEKSLVAKLESKLLKADTLYRVDVANAAGMLQPLPDAPAQDARWLLFLHGTQSSSVGSFGALWQSAVFGREMPPAGFADVLAFEHRTLSSSPARNVEALAQQLPAGARLVVVGYSRGGLVGELLARACPVDGKPGLDDDDIARYRRCVEVEADAAEAKAEVAALQDAVRQLRKKNITIEWLLPVGAPLAGTTLASGKLSRLLSQLVNLGSIAPLVQGTTGAVTGVLLQLLAATARDIVDFRDIPGLQAMNPGGALVTWLARGRGPASVSALKSRASSEGLRALMSYALDSLFERDNDWVVDTASMVPPPRPGDTDTTATTFELDVSGTGVYHLSYFANDRVQRVLTQLCLCAPDTRRERLAKLGFKPVLPPAVPVEKKRAALPADAPILFVLPGIMGTELHVGDDRVWLDKLQLFFGGMSKLGIAAPVTAGKPLDDGYRDLVAYFAASHEVIAFGYDWRLSLSAAAERLNARVREVAARAGDRPICFLAHSMGGLVVRTMMALDDSQWSRVSAHPKSRFLMLGTPNGGSHAISQILCGEEGLLKLLAFGSSSLHDIVGLCGAFPGVLDMLPEFAADTQTEPSDQFFDINTWRQLRTASGSKLPLPAPAEFQRALELRRRLRAQTLPPEKVFYVAGTREETPVNVQLREHWFGRQRIVFTATADGDGRVPWNLGIPRGVRHWFVDAIHGDLSSDRGLFAGYADILAGGAPRHRRFATARPLRTTAARGAGPADIPLLRRDAGLLPGRGELALAALGASVGTGAADATDLPQIRVTVCCGDVRSARYPVLVGHYRDDGLYSAEAALNDLMENALQRSIDVGTHPGEIGQNKVFELSLGGRQRRRTLVVGLGEFGLLGTGRLVDTLAQAATSWIEEQLRDGVTQPANLSAVLVGTGTGGVGVEPALQALLEALISATARFAGECRAAWPLELEIVELYSDRAHRAWHTLDRLIRRVPRLRDRYTLAPSLRFAGTGMRRAYYEEDASWAQRVRVVGKFDRRRQRLRSLNFEVFSALARVSAQQVGINHEMTRSLIDSASELGPESADVSVALYHLLVPREIKEARPNGERLVLIVDRIAAGIPWELLRPTLYGVGNEPLSVQGGMVRQLSLPNPAPALRRVRNRQALVIGDPRIGPNWSQYFGQLDGARREGADVKQLLAQHGFSVNTDEPRTTAQVTIALHRQPYQVLHIAAHGVFEWLEPLAAGATAQEREKWTGAVLENGTFRPSDVIKLAGIPELVFINCCHLGRIGGVATNYPQLAANLAQSFIALGARAVVAAGWAVNDRAALQFARTFYTSMLAGAPFIEAVRDARVEVFLSFPDDNTWGAYQCYGSDSYVLVDRERAAAESPPAHKHACSVHDLVLSVIAPATDKVRRAKDDEVEGIIAELHAALEPVFGDKVRKEYDAAIERAEQASLPAPLHVALCNFYWDAGAFVPAARHAEAAWQYDGYHGSTQMLTRSAAAASRAALLTDDIGDSIELIKRARRALPELRRLPRKLKRLTTIASVLRRRAMIEPTAAVIARAETAYKNLLANELTDMGCWNGGSPSPIAAWGAALVKARGADRKRLVRLVNVVNQRVIVLLVRYCKDPDPASEAELTAYAQLPWTILRKGRFWRVVAHADWLMLRTILAAHLRLKTARSAARAPEHYAQVLRDALVVDPGRDRISHVHETLVSLQWFLCSDTPAGKVLDKFRLAFERLTR